MRIREGQSRKKKEPNQIAREHGVRRKGLHPKI